MDITRPCEGCISGSSPDERTILSPLPLQSFRQNHTGGFMETYYNPEDLGHFGNVGNHRPELFDAFMKWYTAATATEGALSKREKSLIGLAVAHAIQCPY